MPNTVVGLDVEATLKSLFLENNRLNIENKELREQLDNINLLIENGIYVKKKSKEELKTERIARKEQLAARAERIRNGEETFVSRRKEAASSLDEIRTVTDYLASHGRAKTVARNTLMWKLGLGFGIRVSDIVKLRYGDLFSGKDFRERMFVVEKKTSKLNNLLITDWIKEALNEYLAVVGWEFEPNDYLIASQKGAAIDPQTASEIFADASNDMEIGFKLGSHSMRKTFVDIVFCVAKVNIDDKRLFLVQQLLNHESSRTTIAYTGQLRKEMDKARVTVSDYLMGKTDVNVLTPPEESSLEDVNDLITKGLKEINEKLDRLELLYTKEGN